MEYKYRMKLKRIRKEINELKEKNKVMELQMAAVMNYINQQGDTDKQPTVEDCN